MADLSALAGAEHFLAGLAAVLAAGLLAHWLAAKLKLPDLVLFLCLGALLGPHAAGLLDVPSGSLLEVGLLCFGASYILFEGGLDARLSQLREIGVTVGLLATLGVLITAALVAATAHFSLGMPWLQAALLGSCISATDPAALIPLFKQIRVRQRLAQAVICEAAFNDAVSAVLAFALLGGAGAGAALSAQGVVGDFFLQAGLGLMVGLLLGLLAGVVVGHDRWGFLRAHTALAMLVTVIAAYAAASLVHGSGFMAVFVAGMVIGNRDLLGLRLSEHEARHLHEYTETTSLVLRMLLFMLVGAKLDFAAMAAHWAGTLACVACLVLVARPLAVLACALPDRRARWSGREILFMCWTRETGVIPAVLAGLLLAGGLEGAGQIAAVIFSAVLVTLVVQGGTTRWVAKLLGVAHA